MGKIIYDISGGYSGFLGNILFQTAAAVGIATKHGMDYAFPYKKEFDSFSGGIPVFNTNTFSEINFIDIHEKSFRYEDIVLDKTKHYNLLGYRQSYKYFEHCQPLIKELFEFNAEIKNYINGKYINDIPPSNVMVSVHVRRGDYLNHPNEHPTLDVDYYFKAISLINDIVGDKSQYIIFSNDLKWCEDNFFKHPQYKNFIFSYNNSPEQDLYFMTQCTHHVIANSTMSWWGSYLCNKPSKIVFAPPKNKWFGKNRKSDEWSVDDLYMDDWRLLK